MQLVNFFAASVTVSVFMDSAYAGMPDGSRRWSSFPHPRFDACNIQKWEGKARCDVKAQRVKDREAVECYYKRKAIAYEGSEDSTT
jgi:hypothetical protein